MNISTALDGFRIDRLADGYSPRTIVKYVDCVKRIVDYLEDKEISEVTKEDLKNFFYYLRHEYVPIRVSKKTGPLSPATIDNYWIAMRSFFGWCELELGVPRPDGNIPQPKYQPEEVIPFTKEEVQKLVQASMMVHCTPANKQAAYAYRLPNCDRNKAILLVLLDTGIRLGELVRLRRKDINLETGDLTVRSYRSSKKSKPRTIPLGRVSRKELWKYIESIDDLHPEDIVFELSHGGVRSVLKRLQERANVENVHPHRFRHTFAVEFLRNGGDVFTLQYFLGHSTLEMVKRYLYFTQDSRREAHERAAPGDRWFKRKRL